MNESFNYLQSGTDFIPGTIVPMQSLGILSGLPPLKVEDDNAAIKFVVNENLLNNLIRGNIVEHIGKPITGDLIETITKSITETIINELKNA